jgi:cobalt-zinc-cadmium efflux system outer membrane protein
MSVNCSDYIVRCAAGAVMAAAVGCTSIPADLGRSDVDDLVAERGRPVDSVPAESVSPLLELLSSEPLTADAAVRIALLNNPSLSARYASLGFAAADLYEAGRIRNPVLSAAFLQPNVVGDLNQNTFGLVASFTDLLTLRARRRLADAEYATMKQEIGAAVLSTAADVEVAFYDYVGAKQIAALRAQVAKANALSRDLAARYRDAGNLTPGAMALEQAEASMSAISALDAEAEVFAKRKSLADLLGLSVGGPWDAPAQLPEVGAGDLSLADLVALADRRRLDLAAARGRAEQLAKRLGVAEWTRWVGEFSVGAETERETDGTRITGPSASWSAPIFSQNRDQILRLDARLQAAIADVARTAISAENDVRLAYAAMENARARAEEYRDRLIPARVAAVSRAQEEQNFMLIGIFEVIAVKQQEYDAYQGYLESVRNYWIARAKLTRSVGDSLPGPSAESTPSLDVQDYIGADESGADAGHMSHGAMGHGGMHHGATEPAPSAKASSDQSAHDSAAPGEHSSHQPAAAAKPPKPQPIPDEHEGHGEHR